MNSYGRAEVFQHTADEICDRCRGHSVQARYNHISDVLEFYIDDGKEIIVYDETQFKAMCDSYNSIQWGRS